jgi:hypothetical protein
VAEDDFRTLVVQRARKPELLVARIDRPAGERARDLDKSFCV